MCEKQGYVERFYVERPKDKVDYTLADMQRYTKNLIEKETNLNNLLEVAIKQVAREDEAQANSEDLDILDDIEEIEKEITDEDFEEFLELKNGGDELNGTE